MERRTTATVETEDELRALLGEPAAIVVSKIATRLNRLTRAFIERSPLVCLATSDREGSIAR